ncbi:Hypothetical protein CINCED_3A016464 [Cinara cedri]|uniref:Uncharacterized protein n=1 Tax=Cinara cedri TaxID=506608 RepID=A0A5E4M895_9HEMI|nr:Hypothetical protein CINCED_3A016464 [Cinara cedri]
MMHVIMNRRYGIDKLLLLIFIVLDFHVLASVADDDRIQNVTVSLYSHNKTDIFDITTIYRITSMDVYNDSNVGFADVDFLTRHDGRYQIEIHSRTNAIAMPINLRSNKDYLANNILKINIPELYDDRFMPDNNCVNVTFEEPGSWKKIKIESTGKTCDTDEYYSPSTKGPKFDIENINTACYDALDYIYGNQLYYNGNQTFFTVHWVPKKKQTCVAITYLHRLKSDMEIIISILFNVNNTLITSHKLEKEDVIKTLIISNMTLVQDQTYEITLKRTFGSMRNYYGLNSYYGNWFGLLHINECTENIDEEIKTVSLKENGKRPKAFGVLRNEAAWFETVNSTQVNSTICLNGGYELFNETPICVCPPGFTGKFCEKGCGANLYGADCKGICSMHPSKMCRGIFMCTQYYGCTCPAGLTGPLCNKDCESGTYGANCANNCSSNCRNNVCDRYTGMCSQGCSSGYVLPYCLEKYPYLVKPPTLLSSKYEELEISINFQSDNVKGGDGITKLKYYQIVYTTGDLSRVMTFRSNFKLITDNNNETSEVLSDLKADTEYTVGVLLITADGNFNAQDMVYGKYKTSCIQSLNVEYNVMMYNNFVLYWFVITTKRLECNIVKYVLTLTLNKSQNEVPGTKEIISSSKSFHRIDDLYPGYPYNIKMNPETSMGSLQPSPTYSFTLPITDDDIKINNIFTTTEGGNIKVSWQLENSYQHESIYEPVTYVVRYKINRILSCCLKPIKQNWTSVTVFNRTEFEITNAIPNSQYSIQVGVAVKKDINSVKYEKMVFTLTPESYPLIEPVIDPFNPPRVTNSSVFVKWRINHSDFNSSDNCIKLNGFISNFYVELLDTKDNLLQIRETKENHILFDDLNLNSSYELKVFIQTNVGYNPEHFLFIKVNSYLDLTPIKNLMVYKKSQKYRMVGLRWSYLNKNSSFDGFLTELNGNDSENTDSVSIIPPEKCSAWPEYYCYTLYNLDPSIQYKYAIKPMYSGISEGSDASSISFNCIDNNVPGAPTNLRSVDIGKTYVTLQWDIPWVFNGILAMFAIDGKEIPAEHMDTINPQIIDVIKVPFKNEVPSYNYNLTGLKPGSTYSIGVFSVITSEIRLSSAAKVIITTNSVL